MRKLLVCTLVVALCALASLPVLAADPVVAGPAFSDITGDDAEYELTVMAALGIMTGDIGIGGPARPEATITRAEICKILVGALGYARMEPIIKGVAPSFKDAAQIQPWAWGWINIAQQLQLIGGYPDGTFKANNTVNYAEVVAMLVRCVFGHEAQVKKSLMPWPMNYIGWSAMYGFSGDVVPFAKNATQTIPIVALMSLDPVRAGIVPSLAHPGGNLTGFTFLLSELAGKRLEFLREVMPRLSRVAVVWNPDHPDPDFKDTQVAAARLGIRLQSIEVRKLDDFDGALAMATRDRAEAVIVVSSRLMNLRRSQLLDFAAKSRIPIATGWGAWVQNGALLSYGPNIDEIVRQSASHADKILRGAKPADLPIEQPTRFELVLNLRTARTLNLTVPQSLLARADRVIE